MKCNGLIELLVKRSEVPTVTDESAWRAYQQTALDRLRETTFRYTRAEDAPRQRDFRSDGSSDGNSFATWVFDSFDSMTIGIKTKRPQQSRGPTPMLALAVQPDARSTFAGGGSSRPSLSDRACAARRSRSAIPPQHPSVPDTCGQPDVAFRCLVRRFPNVRSAICWQASRCSDRNRQPGRSRCMVRATPRRWRFMLRFSILRSREIVLADPPSSHEDPQTPEFLGVLRIGDLPHNLALAYPRPITFVGKMPEAYKWTQQLYEQLGAGDRIRVIEHTRVWRPR